MTRNNSLYFRSCHRISSRWYEMKRCMNCSRIKTMHYRRKNRTCKRLTARFDPLYYQVYRTLWSVKRFTTMKFTYSYFDIAQNNTYRLSIYKKSVCDLLEFTI